MRYTRNIIPWNTEFLVDRIYSQWHQLSFQLSFHIERLFNILLSSKCQIFSATLFCLFYNPLKWEMTIRWGAGSGVINPRERRQSLLVSCACTWLHTACTMLAHGCTLLAHCLHTAALAHTSLLQRWLFASFYLLSNSAQDTFFPKAGSRNNGDDDNMKILLIWSRIVQDFQKT